MILKRLGLNHGCGHEFTVRCRIWCTKSLVPHCFWRLYFRKSDYI